MIKKRLQGDIIMASIETREKEKGEKGFTLIELAIVMVIIGLLLGSILKGQSMIKDAKIQRIAADVKGIVAATYSYQDEYGYLPGDDPTNRSGSTRLNATDCTAGNGNGLFDTNAEDTCFWQELIGAGFMNGDPTDHTEATVAKRTPFGGIYYIRYGTLNGKTGNYIYAPSLPNSVIESLDEKYDDGKYNSGNIQSSVTYTKHTNANMYWFAF